MMPQSNTKVRPFRAAAVAAALAASLLQAGPLRAQAQAGAGGPPLVGAIEVTGNSRLPENTILGVLPFRIGDRVGPIDIQKAIGRLWATGQFDDVTLYAVEDSASQTNPDAPVTLRVQVVERPLLGALEFHGLQNVSSSTVRDTVGLRVNEPLNTADLTEAEAVIRSLLANKGYFARSVTYDVTDMPDRPGEKRVVFNVEEGLRVAIAQVEFDGNQAFTDAQLSDAMDTKREGFFWFRSGKFDEENFRSDLRDKLPSFYHRSGYIDFSVLGDTLIVDPLSGKARLVVRLSEGPQYHLASFDIVGNRHFDTEFLRRYFEEGRGGLLRNFGLGGGERAVEGESVFDAVAFAEAADEVRQLYQNDGYLYSQLNDVYERLPGDSAGPAVRATWQITENNPAFVNEVRIEGNTYTHENVIRGQLIVLPGDLYSQERVITSYQRISALGFFETPLPTPEIVPDQTTGDVNITFKVKEKQTGSVNFGTSLGGYSGLAGFLGYDQPNLFGQAKSGHLRWEYGQYSNNFEASYTDPSISGSYLSGALSLFSSSDRFFTFSEGRRRRTGVSTQVGLPVLSNDYRTRLTIGYSISRTTYQEFDTETASSLFSLPPGVQSTVSLGLERSTTDHPLFPTVGARASLKADFNGGILGGDGKFQKLTLTGDWYVPVGQIGGTAPGTRPIRLTLGLSAEGGAIFGDASRFPFDRFWLGGVQFGRPLRGYEETTITPVGYSDRNSGLPLTQRFGDAYMRLSASYSLRFNDNISVGAFFDAGNVWQRPSEIDPTRLFRGAGLGITLVTPFGPLGLDYAYGFDKQPPGWQLHFKFGQGY